MLWVLLCIKPFLVSELVFSSSEIFCYRVFFSPTEIVIHEAWHNTITFYHEIKQCKHLQIPSLSLGLKPSLDMCTSSPFQYWFTGGGGEGKKRYISHGKYSFYKSNILKF